MTRWLAYIIYALATIGWPLLALFLAVAGLGFILLGVGLGQLTSWVIVGPLIIIAIGVGLLLTGFFRRGPQE